MEEQFLNTMKSRICSVLHCKPDEIQEITRLYGGMCNLSFIFRVKEIRYVYREAGRGTEQLINRFHEKQALEIASKWGFDPTYLAMDASEGWKLSYYVESYREPDYEKEEDMRRVAQTLKRLHQTPVVLSFGIRPWEEAEEMLRVLEEKQKGAFEPYKKLREQIFALCEKVSTDSVDKCFCHGDTYKPNWMFCGQTQVILIDWEYGGYSDPGVDVGYYITDAGYTINQARCFIQMYLAEEWSEEKEFHFLAYTAIIAYYWFVWALYREADGFDTKDVQIRWLEAARRFLIL